MIGAVTPAAAVLHLFSRKAEGGAPQWRRKITLRWLASQKPHAAAMADWGSADFASIVLARRTAHRVRLRPETKGGARSCATER